MLTQLDRAVDILIIGAGPTGVFWLQRSSKFPRWCDGHIPVSAMQLTGLIEGLGAAKKLNKSVCPHLLSNTVWAREQYRLAIGQLLMHSELTLAQSFLVIGR